MSLFIITILTGLAFAGTDTDVDADEAPTEHIQTLSDGVREAPTEEPTRPSGIDGWDEWEPEGHRAPAPALPGISTGTLNEEWEKKIEKNKKVGEGTNPMPNPHLITSTAVVLTVGAVAAVGTRCAVPLAGVAMATAGCKKPTRTNPAPHSEGVDPSRDRDE